MDTLINHLLQPWSLIMIAVVAFLFFGAIGILERRGRP